MLLAVILFAILLAESLALGSFGARLVYLFNWFTIRIIHRIGALY